MGTDITATTGYDGKWLSIDKLENIMKTWPPDDIIAVEVANKSQLTNEELFNLMLTDPTSHFYYIFFGRDFHYKHPIELEFRLDITPTTVSLNSCRYNDFRDDIQTQKKFRNYARLIAKALDQEYILYSADNGGLSDEICDFQMRQVQFSKIFEYYSEKKVIKDIVEFEKDREWITSHNLFERI